MVHLETVPTRRERVLTQRADDELVLLDVDAGSYLALNEVGGRVWELCDGTRTIEAIVLAISAEFDAPLEVIEADVQALLKELAADGLVEA